MNSFVAPRAGAWIETSISASERRRNHVAPRAGAWIETNTCTKMMRHRMMSLPVRERGSKRRGRRQQ